MSRTIVTFPAADSQSSHQSRSNLQRASILSLGLLLSSTAGAFAQASFGTHAVGTSTSQPVTVTAAAAGTVATVEVLTRGIANLDYTAGSGTCGSASLALNQQCTQTVNFTPASPGPRLGAVVLLDSGNRVLGVTYLQGTGSGGVPVLVPGNMVPYAGSGAWDLVDDGQPATSADLNLPSSVALDGAGNLYIADSIHDRIRKVDAATQIISTVVGNGNSGFAPNGTVATNAALNTPSGVAIDGAGNLYIADTGNNVVRVVSAATGLISTVAGTGTVGNTGDNGPATAANLDQPWGVTVDGAGNLFIADTNNHEIRKVNAATGIITTVAGTGYTTTTGAGDYSGDGRLATVARLNRPYAVAFNAAGDMYIPDSDNNRVRVVSAATGIITTLAGIGTNGYSGDGGPANAAELWVPSGLAVDPAGNVYIADSQNNAIRKVSAATGNISTLVRNGVGEYVQNQKFALNALYGPMGLALDGSGNLFVADYYFMRVREIQAGTAPLDFTSSPVRQGSVSSPKPQMLENDGNADLSVASVTPDANSTLDIPSTTCTGGVTLTAGTHCMLGVEFAPSVAGNPLFANIAIAAQSGNTPLSLALVGNATAVNSTTVVLNTNANPSGFSQSITLSAAVTTGKNTGALTGTVTFYDGSTKLQSGVAVNANGGASISVATLSVGSHSLTAAYSGDNLHFASTSAVMAQVVNEGTTTSVASNANPSAVGAAVTFTATVRIANGGGVTPDGTVTFMDGGNPLTTVPLTAGGTATYSTSTLIDGQHAITASFSGDAATFIAGSSSPAFNQDVLAASTVAVTSGPNPSNYGTAVTFTATVTSTASVAPSGTVNFMDGATQIGTATLAGTTGVATFTTSQLGAGTHAITAVYKGSPNCGPGTSPGLVQTVNLTQTTTAIAASPTPAIAGKSVNLTAAVSVIAGSATVTGTVTFSDGTVKLGTAPIANGIAVLSPILAPGAHAIVASYGGDANDDASTSVAMPVNVILATTAVSLKSSGTPALVLSGITFTATVAGNGGAPTGSVIFSIDGANAGTAMVGAGGTATFTDSALAVGSHNVVATYSGDTNDNPSTSASLAQYVGSIPTVTSLGISASAGPNSQAILVATALGSTGPIPTGTVTFTYGDSNHLIGSATLDSSGVATVVPDLPAGNYLVVASYAGDALHGASTSTQVKFSGTPIGFAIAVNPPTMTLVSSQNGTLTINVASANGFADNIGMGCLSLPSGVNCHFSSNSVALKAGQSQSVQVTIDTNAPLSGGQSASNANAAGKGLTLASLGWPAGLLLGFVLWRFRRRNPAALMAALILFLAGAMAVTGCGASFSQHTVAPGTYTIQVGGVGTASNISHYTNVTLTITK